MSKTRWDDSWKNASMKNAVSLLPRLLLIVCLVSYGPLAMAGTGSGGTAYTMEICANGVAEIVRFDADGNPVKSVAACVECLTCCHVTGVEPEMFTTPSRSLALPKPSAAFALVDTLFIGNANVRPLPRGPPLAHLSTLTAPDAVVTDHADSCHDTRSDERPRSKDAAA